jgi:hypothetical protein
MASVLSIVAITIERYWSINHSVHYRRYTTKMRIRIFSILIWLIPFLNFAPGIWLLAPHENIKTTNITKKSYPQCIGAYHTNTLYLIIAQINFFAWPLVVIIILNGLIVVSLYQRSQRFPIHDGLLAQRRHNILRQRNDQTMDEEQTVENDEPTASMIHDNSYYMLKMTDLVVII